TITPVPVCPAEYSHIITSDPTASFSDAFDANAVSRDDPLAVIGEQCAKLRGPSSSEAMTEPVVRASFGEPFVTLMRARARIGMIFATELRRRAAQLHGQYFHFGLRADVTAPLGWTLSTAARQQIDEMLGEPSGAGAAVEHRLRSKRCNVQEQLKVLGTLL